MFHSLEQYFMDICEQKTGIRLTADQISKFNRYGELLLEWNQNVNLTAITDPRGIIVKHFVDSLLGAKHVSNENIADIGTGAGFPGIPLKILRPKTKLVLMDSLDKRLNFLRQVVREIGLEDVSLVHIRAEDAGKSALYREKFDIVTARAVARLPVLLEYCLPLVKAGGRCILYKGYRAEEEIREAKKALAVLGGKIINIEKQGLDGTAEHRTILLIKKERQTPAIYPRRAGIPDKRPLM